MRDAHPSVRRRNLWLFLVGVGVSIFGDRMVAVALAFAVLEVGGSLAFFPAGMVLWGVVAEAIGASTALWIAFGGLLLIASAFLALPDTRALRRDAPPPLSTRP